VRRPGPREGCVKSAGKARKSGIVPTAAGKSFRNRAKSARRADCLPRGIEMASTCPAKAAPGAGRNIFYILLSTAPGRRAGPGGPML